MKFVKGPQIRILSLVISLAIYLIILLTLDFNNISAGYNITVILPIIFLLCFHMLLWNPVVKARTPYFTMYSIIAFIRYVILSIVTVQNGTYSGLSGYPVSSDNLTLAGLLMILELVSTSIFINYWFHKKFTTINRTDTYYSYANSSVYFLIVIISILLIFVFPEARRGISFFGNISYAQNDEFGSILVLGIRELFINAKYFLLFFIIIALQKNNGINFKKNNLFSYFIILFFVILIIGIRVGSNRKKMISDSIGSLLLLWNLFPKYKKITAILLAALGITLVAWTTVYRGMTGSTGAFFSEYFDLDTLQQYFLGQYNIGIAIEAKDLFSDYISIESFIFGILRPIFGIGSLIQNIDVVYLENLFDHRMSMGIIGFRGDQILPIIAEGYMFFGLLLSPIISIVVARVGIFFDQLYVNTKQIEVLLISSIISFYLAQAMILNGTIILNMLSFRLAIYLPICWLGRIMKRKNNNRLLDSNMDQLRREVT